jgi:peptidoglycan/LPS O-acetylase OafA/YrhL
LGSNQRLEEIDALRGIAALIVVLFHYCSQYQVIMPGTKGLPIDLWWGRYGVELFFGISGFVILMTLHRSSSGLDFAFSRFSRLFPAYWASIFITSAFVWVLGSYTLQVPISAIAVNLTMLQYHFSVPPVDGAYWSLAVEIGFYATMICFWKLKWFDKIEIVFSGWILLKFVWWAFPFLPFQDKSYLFIQYVPFFAIGVLGYRVWIGARTWIQQAPLLILGLSAVLAIDPLPSAFVYLVSVSFFVSLSKAKLSFLCQPFLLWLGSISYALYLLHQYIGFATMAWFEEREWSLWTGAAVSLMLSMALAQAVTQWIERPSLNLLRQVWRRYKGSAGLRRQCTK